MGLADVIGAILKAGKWLDDLDNRRKAIPTICGPAYINTPQRNVESRLFGHYDLGDGLGTRTSTDDRVAFFQNGAVPALRRSHVLWFLAQYQRLGLVKQAPDYHRIADGILMRDLYNGVAEKEGVPVPDDDMAPIRIKLDGALFDPSKPAEEVKRS